MAGGPQVYNVGSQNMNQMETLALGVNAGSQISGMIANFKQLQQQKDQMFLTMFDNMARQMGENMNGGYFAAIDSFADDIGKIVDPDGSLNFVTNLRAELNNPANQRPQDIVQQALTDTYNMGGVQNGQTQPTTDSGFIPPSEPEQTVSDTGGTISGDPNAYINNVNRETPVTQDPTYTQKPVEFQARPEGQATTSVVTEEGQNPNIELQNKINALPTEGNPFEKKEQYKQSFQAELKTNGYSEPQIRKITADLNSQDRFTENGVNLEGYNLPGIEEITPEVTNVNQTVFSGSLREMGEFNMTTNEVGVPEGVLTLNEGKTLHETTYRMIASLDKSFTGQEPTGISRDEMRPTQRYWMDQIENDERNLSQLATLTGKSVEELKSLPPDDLGALYSDNSAKMEYHISFIPGSNTWRDVFGDPEMDEGLRDTLVDAHEEVDIALEKDDTTTAVELLTTTNDIVGEEQVFNNELSRLEWIFGVAGNGDPFNEDGISQENVMAGLQLAIDSAQSPSLSTQRLSNEGRQKELEMTLLNAEMQMAAMASNGMISGDYYKEWQNRRDDAKFAQAQAMDNFKVESYYNEQYMERTDQLRDAWNIDVGLLDAAADDQWGKEKWRANPDEYVKLLSEDPKNVGTVERLNQNWLLQNPTPTRQQVADIYFNLGNTEEEVMEIVGKYEEVGYFNDFVVPNVEGTEYPELLGVTFMPMRMPPNLDAYGNIIEPPPPPSVNVLGKEWELGPVKTEDELAGDELLREAGLD